MTMEDICGVLNLATSFLEKDGFASEPLPATWSSEKEAFYDIVEEIIPLHTNTKELLSALESHCLKSRDVGVCQLSDNEVASCPVWKLSLSLLRFGALTAGGGMLSEHRKKQASENEEGVCI